MQKFNANKTGLAFGLFLGGWHLVWSVLVFTGLGQVLWDFVLWAHMIHLQFVIGPFDLFASLCLIAFTSVSGYVMGYTIAWAWNWAHK